MRSDSATAAAFNGRIVSSCRSWIARGVETRRRQAVEVLDRAASGGPAVADAEPDVEAGEVIGAAGLQRGPAASRPGTSDRQSGPVRIPILVIWLSA